ncbi:MAG: RDD family protein [Xanthomonadales bacterium]|nr:RDD family protein [Xanthomonadales bacterium]
MIAAVAQVQAALASYPVHCSMFEFRLMPAKIYLFRRFAAIVYDLLVLAALWMATAAVCLALTAGHMDVMHPPWWQRLALLAVSAGYFMLSWCRIGQTVGMRPWRIRVLREDGGNLRADQALARFVLASVSLLLLGAGFWWAWVDREQRTAHDRLCRTRVVLLSDQALRR